MTTRFASCESTGKADTPLAPASDIGSHVGRGENAGRFDGRS